MSTACTSVPTSTANSGTSSWVSSCERDCGEKLHPNLFATAKPTITGMFVLAMLVGMIICVIFSVSRVASLVVQVKRMLLRLITAQVAHIEEASSSGAAVAEDDGKGVGIPTQDKGDDDEDDPEVCAITAQHTAEQEHDTAPPQDEDSDDALSRR